VVGLPAGSQRRCVEGAAGRGQGKAWRGWPAGPRAAAPLYSARLQIAPPACSFSGKRAPTEARPLNGGGGGGSAHPDSQRPPPQTTSSALPDAMPAESTSPPAVPPAAQATAAPTPGRLPPRPSSPSTLDVSCAATLTDDGGAPGSGSDGPLGGFADEKTVGEPVVVSFETPGLAHLNPRVRPLQRCRSPIPALGSFADEERLPHLFAAELVAWPPVRP
jgi:hypothetical protein